MDDALARGLRLHNKLMMGLAGVIPDHRLIPTARIVDALIAAVVVETLERCTTPELREAEIRKCRETFESRWTEL